MRVEDGDLEGDLSGYISSTAGEGGMRGRGTRGGGSCTASVGCFFDLNPIAAIKLKLVDLGDFSEGNGLRESWVGCLEESDHHPLEFGESDGKAEAMKNERAAGGR